MRPPYFVKFTRYSSLFCGLILSLGTVYAEPIKIVTWNLEWLTSSPNHRFSQSERTKEDFDTLTKYANRMSPGIVAFQEVNDVNAIKKVLGTQYRIILSDRASKDYKRHQFKEINQYTGFAVRNDLTTKNHGDLRLASNKSSKLRFATYISINISGQEIHLLSVHLKAGCRGKFKNNRSCKLLKQEVNGINQWIASRARQNHSFIVLGDFNHNLAYSNDWLYKLAIRGADPEPVLVSANSDAICQVRSTKSKGELHSYRYLIDHMIASADLALSEPYQLVYSKPDVLAYQLSDHCPLITKYLN
ncbi:endonuclease/exonuclease/phosphatase family protein [Vibrio sp. HN007]|uniref:endonuclease/exonuclease/phosphatase family protein n=1 Tax=Vibrio iocasae TaxID=3098914 RepID=UPI0035D4B3BB